MKKHTAIVLSAGRGSRMHSTVQKQYLEIKEKPVIAYSLEAFQKSPYIDEIILVTGESDRAYCRREIVERYGITKVKKIVAGGRERYHSVYCGLLAAEDCGYVYIHDGARPFVDASIIERVRGAVLEYEACVAGMPVKDTIKISDGAHFAASTPKRALVWQIQTPQAFAYPLALQAYEKLFEELENGSKLEVTDDAMVVEEMLHHRVRLVEGDYRNIKITTPEDLLMAETFLNENDKNFEK